MGLETPLPYLGFSVINLIWAGVILVAGYVLTKIIVSSFKGGMKRTNLPALVVEFLGRFLSALLYVIIILMAVAALGYNVSSVVLGLSAVIGLILGFGLQDTLKNLAAGVWIAALRPMDIGEVITVKGITGKVTGIGLMSTELLQADNTFVMVPNSLVWGDIIINHTRMPVKRVNVDVGVAYGTDLDMAIKTAMNLMKSHPQVLDDPEPSVAITSLGDSAINLQLRAWTKTENYWGVKGDLTRGIYEKYREEGIEIPFPQLDVHVKEH